MNMTVFTKFGKQTLLFSMAVTFLMMTTFVSCKNPDETQKSLQECALAYKGADISYYDQLRDLGATYRKDGKDVDLLDILKSSGVNCLRLRLWVNPEDGYCGTARSLEIAKQIKTKGFRLLLDFHYSDTFTDPEHQTIPAAWKDLTAEQLYQKVYSYTKETLSTFKNNGVTPDMVQIGNEINAGILWPYGKYWEDEAGNKKPDDFTNMFAFLNSGIRAAREVCPKAKIMLHSATGHSKGDSEWLFGEFEKAALDYDMIGLSFYTYVEAAAGKTPSLEGLKSTLTALQKFQKEVVVVETYYPWTLEWNDEAHNTCGSSSVIQKFPATKQGQKSYLKELCQTVSACNGTGVFWWEPESISVQGFENNLENACWFDFEGNYLGTGDAFKE